MPEMKQLPLPGFSDLVDHSEYIPLLAGHMLAREHFTGCFEFEVATLRIMGKKNDAQCPQAIYSAQRKLCIELADVLKALDDSINAISGKVMIDENR